MKTQHHQNSNPEKNNHSPKDGRPKFDIYPLIAKGMYQVTYLDHAGPKICKHEDEKRYYIHWKIIDPGPHFGTILFQSFKYYDRYGRDSKFYRNWTIANGSRPRTSTRMSFNVFKNKIFLAAVRTVKPIYEKKSVLKGETMPECMWYSLVDELKKVEFSPS